jgi:guanine deaminase
MVTPRFIPSCTDTLLAGLGDLARAAEVAVTTHVSESDWEHGFVRDRHGMSDAESLDRFGLLRPGSVLAHGCFLSDGDMGLMRDRGTGVAHCPWSNAYFANAVFPLRRALDIGVPVGLGSDISGGPVGSVWETARMALVAARLRASGTDPDLAPEARSRHPGDRIDAVTAFWLATAGGADALGLDVGRFRPGQRLDAILVAPEDDTSAIAPWPGEEEAPARRLERLVHGTSRADIADVFVDGRRVSGARR